MRVGLNATCIGDRPSGAKNRFLGINRELVKLLHETEFVVYEPSDCRVASWFQGAPNVSARRTPLPSAGRVRRYLGGLGFWPTALATEGLDLFECSHLPLVKAPAGQTLLTIHDVRGLRPEEGVFGRAVFRSVLSRALESADHVVTVSESMKREILSLYPSVPISVVYNGLDAAVFGSVSDEELAAFKREHALPDEVLLAVGHFEGRKNYRRLVDAVARLRDRGRPVFLLIVGNDSGERRAVEARVAAASLGGNVRILSGLSESGLRCAYRLCRLFVFPSAYEGFGIPILEAMAAGRPFVLSDIPVFREVTEGRGVYFPHDDVEAMALAIERVLSSAEEAARLVRYGRERVKDFAFPVLAGQVAGLYRSLAGGR